MDDEPARLPIRIVVTDDLERSRVTVFFRLLLAIPHLVVVALWGIAAAAVSIVLWLALLVEGKAPRALQSFVVSYLRYAVQVSAYVHLAAAPYPPFGGGDGYPVDLEVEPRHASRGAGSPPASCSRSRRCSSPSALGGGSWFGDLSWARVREAPTPAGRPAGAPAGVAATAAFLAWFASLARGRTPARPPRPDRLLHRLHGAGARLPAARHRPLSDERPRPGAAVRRAAATPRATRAHGSRRALAAHRLLPAPARDPAPDLALAVERARAPRRRSSPGSRRSPRGACRRRCTASSRPGCATRCTSAPSCS